MKIPRRIHGIDKWKFDQRLNALTTLNHAMSIRFKAYGVSVVAQTVKRGWHSSRLLKADQYAAFAVFFLSTFLPYGQAGSFSLFGPAIAPAEHWHWFSKFRKRCLPAKPAEGPADCSLWPGYNVACTLAVSTGSIRSIPRQFCAEAVRSVPELMISSLPAGSKRTAREKYRTPIRCTQYR